MDPNSGEIAAPLGEEAWNDDELLNVALPPVDHG